MMHRRFGMQPQAVAGVIEALLLVALVSIVISTIQLVYVPQIMEQKEAEHMDQVFNQFSSMKSMIDMQSITKSSSPISSMITLGNSGLPYFITAEASGELSTQENSTYKITINPPPSTLPSGIAPLTSIVYAADNAYFVDQSYILEGGGIIVEQPGELGGEPVMRADPSISSVNNTNSITIHMDLTHVVAIPGKDYTWGDKEQKCFIRTNYSSNTTHLDSIPAGGYIRVYTKYLNAWNQSVHSILGVYDTHGYLDINDVSGNPGYIEIKPGTKSILLQLNVIDMYVQIGPGWIT
jgi:hypothetical protein